MPHNFWIFAMSVFILFPESAAWFYTDSSRNRLNIISVYRTTVKPVLSSHSIRTPKFGFQYLLSLNAVQKYRRMLHSATLSTFIKLPFAISNNKKKRAILTLYMLVSSADSLCKQFGPSAGLSKYWAWSRSKLFDIDRIAERIFWKPLSWKNNNSRQQQKNCKISQHVKNWRQ